MLTTSDVLAAMKQSTKFIEGKSPENRKCSCEKCVVSLYRHTHEPDLADSRHSFWDYLRFCVTNVPDPSGLWLEFGVGDGRTLAFIADQQKGRLFMDSIASVGFRKSGKSVTTEYTRSINTPEAV